MLPWFHACVRKSSRQMQTYFSPVRSSLTWKENCLFVYFVNIPSHLFVQTMSQSSQKILLTWRTLQVCAPVFHVLLPLCQFVSLSPFFWAELLRKSFFCFVRCLKNHLSFSSACQWQHEENGKSWIKSGICPEAQIC